MADSAKIRIESQNLSQGGIDRAIGGLRQLASVAGNVSGSLRSGWLGMAGIALTAGRFVKAAFQDYMEGQEAETSLAAALENHGDKAGELLPKYRNLAEAIQAVTRYSDDAVISALALGRNMGIQSGDLAEAAIAAVGLAAKYRIDLPEAMQMIAKAGVGYTARLKQVGIVLDETSTNQERFQQLLHIGTAGFQQAERQAGSMSGGIDRLKNAYSDLKEAFGEGLAKDWAVTLWIQDLTTLSQKLKEISGLSMPEWLRALFGGGLSGAGALRELVGGKPKAPTTTPEQRVAELTAMGPQGGPKTVVPEEIMRPRSVSLHDIGLRAALGGEEGRPARLGTMGQPMHVVVENPPEIE